jgi:serine/threonine-protein kinase
MDIERNLLFAAFALRGALIDLPALTTACRAWAGRHDTPLADVLVRQGAITPDDRAHLDYLVARHLERHHGDSRAGLASLATPDLRHALAATGDLAVAASVAGLPLPPPVAAADLPTRVERMVAPQPGSDGAADEPRYRRLHPHAAGGIGQVWLAYDNAIGREVALKELRPETSADPACRQRFLDEARVTGQLEHPGIVPVHELVRPADGTQPYYIMRFVKGRTLRAAIETYHASAQAGRASRVEMLGLLNAFVAVCNAVAFAHAQGVLHRDLKGQNVILGDFGEVVVLDWGLARRVKGGAESAGLETGITAAASYATLPGQVMGTPGYMAPEQAAGQIDLIDARTDVYGLGAILYEILTARPPFTTGVALDTGTDTALDLPALLRRIQSEAPTPPRQLNRRVPAPLQAICLTALARDRDDRYGSAAELAREVQRWLADEPVTAYPEPFHLRVARWGRRNRLAVTGLAVLLVCAVVGLAVTTLLVNQERDRTDRARDRAEKNYTFARDAVKKLYVQVSEEQLPNEPGLQRVRRKLLETASAFYASLAASEDDPELRSEQGKTLLALAEVLKQMGETDQALKHLDEAQEIYTGLCASQPNNLEYRHGLGRCHLKRGAVLYIRNRAEGAKEWGRARELFQTAGTSAGVRRDLAFCANNFGTFYSAKAAAARDQDERKFWFERSVAESAESERRWRELIREYPKDTQYPSELAILYQNMARLYQHQDNIQEALAVVGRSVQLFTELADRDPDNLQNRCFLGAAHGQAGMFLNQLNRLDAAEEEYHAAVNILESLAAENRAVTFYQTELANVCSNQGQFWEKRLAKSAGEEAAALRARIVNNYRKAQAIYDGLYLKHPREVKYLFRFASMYVLQGNLEYYPNLARAVPLYEKGIAALTPLADHPDHGPEARRLLSDAHWGRAVWLDALKKYEESLASWDMAVQLRTPVSVEVNSGRAHTRLKLAELLLKKNNLAGAAALAEAVAREPKLTGQVWVDTGNLFGGCGKIAAEAGQPALAAHYANRALALLRRAQEAGALQTPYAREKLQRDLRGFELLRRNAEFQRLMRG